MHSGKLVFAQLMEHLPLHTFRRCVAKYPSRYPTLTFSHLDQFLCMAFAQLTFRESLRDIETCLRAHSSKLYHLGIRGGVARSTLADANETRDWRIYQNFAMNLIRVARKLYADDSFAVELDNTVYALDSTSAEARYNLSVAVNAVGLQARETGDHSTAEASFLRVVALQADSELVAAARGSLASGEAR